MHNNLHSMPFVSKYFNKTILTLKNVFLFFTERNGIWLPYVFERWENFDHGNFILFNQTFPCFHTVLRNLYLGSTKDRGQNYIL